MEHVVTITINKCENGFALDMDEDRQYVARDIEEVKNVMAEIFGRACCAQEEYLCGACSGTGRSR